MSAKETTTTRRLLILCALCAVALSVPLASAAQESKPVEGQDGAAVRRPPEINVKPFEDIALEGKKLVEQGRLGPDSTLDLSVTAELNDDGTLKPETVKIDGAASDDSVDVLARQFVRALSQSKVFGILSEEGAKAVRLTLRLDRQNAFFEAASEMPSEDEAARMARGYDVLSHVASVTKRGTSEGELYNAIKFSNDGRQFIMTFEMPKDAAAKIIADLLARKAAKEAAAGRKN
jgi:hypothetical protein